MTNAVDGERKPTTVVLAMKVIGQGTNLMDKALIPWPTEINTRVSGVTDDKMGKAHLTGKVVITI